MEVAEHKRLSTVLRDWAPDVSTVDSYAGMVSWQNATDRTLDAAATPLGRATRHAEAGGGAKRKSAFAHLLSISRRLISALLGTVRLQSSSKTHSALGRQVTTPQRGPDGVEDLGLREHDGSLDTHRNSEGLLHCFRSDGTVPLKPSPHLHPELSSVKPVGSHGPPEGSDPSNHRRKCLVSAATTSCVGERGEKDEHHTCASPSSPAPNNDKRTQSGAGSPAHSLPTNVPTSYRAASQAGQGSGRCAVPSSYAEASITWMCLDSAHEESGDSVGVSGRARDAAASKTKAKGARPPQTLSSAQRLSPPVSCEHCCGPVASAIDPQKGCVKTEPLGTGCPRRRETKTCSARQPPRLPDQKTNVPDGGGLSTGLGKKHCSRRWCARSPPVRGGVKPRRAANLSRRSKAAQLVKNPVKYGPTGFERPFSLSHRSGGFNVGADAYSNDLQKTVRERCDETNTMISECQSFVTAFSDMQGLCEQLERSCSLSHTVGGNHVRPAILFTSRRHVTNSLSTVLDATAADSTPASCLSTEEPQLRPCQEWEIPATRSRAELLNIKRRTCLPCSKNSTGNLSIKKILMQVSSSDMWNFSLPIGVNEPLSLLQRLCEDFEYTDLLSTARTCPSSVERLAFVTAFALSAYASSADRCYKPFNPMLGETFELSHRGINFIGEQVSHHPPVSAYHAAAHNGNFVCFGTVAPKLCIVGAHVESTNCGAVYLRLFLPSGGHEDYTWSRANTKVHNVFFGTMWMEWTGEIRVTNLTTGETAEVSFLPSTGVTTTARKPRSSQSVGNATASSWLPSFRLPGFAAADAAAKVGPSNLPPETPTTNNCLTAAPTSRRPSRMQSPGDRGRSCSSQKNTGGSPSNAAANTVQDLTEGSGERSEAAQKRNAFPTVHCGPASKPNFTCTEEKLDKKCSNICKETARDNVVTSVDEGEPQALSGASAHVLSSVLVGPAGADGHVHHPVMLGSDAPPTAAGCSEFIRQQGSVAPMSAAIWKASAVVGSNGSCQEASGNSSEVRKTPNIHGAVCDRSGRARFYLDGSWSQQIWLTRIGRRSFLATNPEAANDTALKASKWTSSVSCMASLAAYAHDPFAGSTTNSHADPQPANDWDSSGSKDRHGRQEIIENQHAHSCQTESQETYDYDGLRTVDEDQWFDDDLTALVWKANPKPGNAAQFYNMTEFAMELNELTRDYNPACGRLTGTGGVAPTDTRLRPDIRMYEEGAVGAAQEEKNRLEAKQRLRSRERDAKGEPWIPRWFTKRKNPLTGEEDWLYNGLYWRERARNTVMPPALRAALKNDRLHAAEAVFHHFEMSPSLF